jgi:hypothetical protein
MQKCRKYLIIHEKDDDIRKHQSSYQWQMKMYSNVMDIYTNL